MATKTEKLNCIYSPILLPDSEGYQRCQRLREKVVNTTPQVCIERARIITRVYKETENLHILFRRAKSLDAILKEMSIFILEDELFVGHISSKHRSAPIFPEFSVEWIANEIDDISTRPQDKFVVTDDVKAEFFDDIYPYWKGKTLEDHVMAYMTDEIRLLRFDANLFALGIHEGGGLGHVLLDYEKVLTLGMDGLKKEISHQLDFMDPATPSCMPKIRFYQACISICDSVIAFAERYAHLAKEQANACTNPRRKTELLQISKTCMKVPRSPAGSFYEALQSLWFIQIIPQIYDNGVSISPGRFDQYMYPFYEKDITNETLTREKAQEYLECFWLKFTEPIKLYNKADSTFFAGFPMGQNLCIGGLDEYGYDATNDLSYRCLEAHCHHLLTQPNFAVRWHSNSPREYMFQVIKAIRKGNGMPQIANDDVFVPSLLRLGVPLKEARDYGIVGCIEATPKNTWGRYNGGYINLAKIVELTLTNGKCLTSGKQVSIKTGDFISFKTFNDVMDAYKEQVKYCTRQLVIWNNIVDMVHEEHMPTPFTSMLIGDCIQNGKDVTSGGAKYNWTGPSGIGIANAGDSLYAIKKSVFDLKKLGSVELLDMIFNNFESNEVMRSFLWNHISKYGNDIPDVDDITKDAVDIFLDELERYSCYRNGPFVASLLPVSSYIAFGRTTGASADGRLSGEPIADGISPQNGADQNGPTAAAKSVAHIDHVRCANGIIYNQKYSPSTLATDRDIDKFIDMINTYFSIGGAQLQFNVVDSNKLREAQQYPEKYKGLVVRVAGYSAFFDELSKEIQDSIISRTEFNLN